MNRLARIAIAVIIVFFILRQGELYVPRSFLDEEWRTVQTDPKRKADPFNTCSPESFGACAETAFPHLSRY
jgi:hypothetical protein